MTTNNFEFDREGFADNARRSFGVHENDAPVVLETMDIVDTGFNRQNYRVTENQRRWREWYALVYQRGLFPEPTMSNGLGQLNQTGSLLHLPLFRVASDFIADAALSDMPSPSGWDDDGGAQEWWADALPMIERALQRGTNHWAIYNLAVFAAEPGLLRAVEPINYYRIGQPEQRDADAGHVLLFPYRTDAADVQRTNDGDDYFDAVEVVKVPPQGEGEPTSQRFRYSGQIIGAPITGVAPSTIRGVQTAGEGHSLYPGAADTASAYMIALSLYSVSLADYDNRPLAIPSGVATAMQGVAANSEEGLRAIRRQFQDIYRPIVALDPNQDMASGELREPQNLTDRQQQLLTLADLFFIQMRLTPSSFGIGIGRGESGVAREKAQDASGILVRRYRRQLASILAPLVDLMGIPGGRQGLQFTWSIPPFQSREAREEQVRGDYQAGLLTLNEARQEMGRAALDGGDVLRGEPRMVDGAATMLDINAAEQDNNGGAPAEPQAALRGRS